MPVESAADRAAFVSADDFGVAATWVSAGGSATVNGIFDAEYQLLTTALLDEGQEGATPVLHCRTADIPADAAHGDTVTIDSTDYTAVEFKPDGTGMSLVRLQEA